MAIGIALMMNIHFPLNFSHHIKPPQLLISGDAGILLSNWLGLSLHTSRATGTSSSTVKKPHDYHVFRWTLAWCRMDIYYLGMFARSIFSNQPSVAEGWNQTAYLRLLGCHISFSCCRVGLFRADSVQSAIIILKGMAGLHGISIPKIHLILDFSSNPE